MVVGLGAGSGGGTAYGAFEVVSGYLLNNPRDATCRGWNSGQDFATGTAVTQVGQIVVKDPVTVCINEYRVACCKWGILEAP